MYVLQSALCCFQATLAGQVIANRVESGEIRECFFSLLNQKVALQTWPCSSSQLFVTLGTDKITSKPSWKHIETMVDWYVVPTRSVGPLHSLITSRVKDVPIKPGVQLYVAGAPVKVLDWQVQHGFAGIREEELAKLKKELGIKDHVLAIVEPQLNTGMPKEIIQRHHVAISEVRAKSTCGTTGRFGTQLQKLMCFSFA